MLCKTGSSILAQGVMENIAQSTTPQHSIKSKADTVHTLVNMPDIHLLCMILSNFHRLSCLFYWCDSFETLRGYKWCKGRPIVSISQFMKMKPEYHFKLTKMCFGRETIDTYKQTTHTITWRKLWSETTKN